jgi:hypothetical protein
MLDQAIRFGAILSQPEFNRGGSLLEVGSGREGITAFTEDRVIGVDVRFVGGPAAGIIPVKASATALPLQDSCFDRVVCSDMLEHLTAEDRPQAIKELVRVTKKTLFLTCPCGEAARRTDDWIGEAYQFLKVKQPDWLTEHLERRLPDPEEITSALAESGLSWREVPGESTLAHLTVSLLIGLKFLNALWRSLFERRPDRAKWIASIGSFRADNLYRRLWVVDCAKEKSH